MDAATPRSRHSVWGRVEDADGRAVPTAEIFWVDAARADEATVGLFDVHKVAQADRDGRFWAPGLPEGAGLLLPDFERLGVVGDQVTIGHASRVELPTDEEPVLVFPHRRTDYGRIAGVVTDEVDGRPASRLPVALFAEGETEKPLRQAETTTGGAFEFAWLREGNYRIAVWGTARQLEGAAPVELGRNQRIDAKIALHRRPPGPRGAACVRITGELGLGLRGARVRVLLPGIHVAPRTADADGRVAFGDLPARPERAMATAAGHWPGGAIIAPGPLEEPLDVEIVLEPAARLRVAILDAATGKPLRHANVFVSHAGGEQCMWGGVLPPPGAPPRDHHDVDVRLGAVTVRAASPGYATGEARVTIAGGDDEPALTLRLAPE